jgi:hypothetical protein
MGTAAKFVGLERRDRALVLAAARTLAFTWIGLRTTRLSAIQRRAARVAAPDPRSHAWCGPPPRWSVARPTVERIAWAVRAAGRFIPGASNCLVRALATQTLLGRFGYRSDLRIGVRKGPDGRFGAHAWLESGGAVVIGEFEIDQFVPLAPAGSGRSGPTVSQE